MKRRKAVTPRRRKIFSPGRPTRLTPKLQKAICNAIAKKNMSPTGAGLRCGVPAQTLSDWRKTNPEFSDALERARATQEEKLLAAVRDGVNNAGLPDWKAAAWILERLHRESYGIKPAEINVAAGANVNVGIQIGKDQLVELQARRMKQLEKLRLPAPAKTTA